MHACRHRRGDMSGFHAVGTAVHCEHVSRFRVFFLSRIRMWPGLSSLRKGVSGALGCWQRANSLAMWNNHCPPAQPRRWLASRQCPPQSSHRFRCSGVSSSEEEHTREIVFHSCSGQGMVRGNNCSVIVFVRCRSGSVCLHKWSV